MDKMDNVHNMERVGKGRPRVCRTVTPAWLVYSQVGFTAVSSCTALAFILLGAKKGLWIAAFVLLAAATITGAHADTSLRIWLATDKCNDTMVRNVLFCHETYTALVILGWLAACIWLTCRKNVR